MIKANAAGYNPAKGLWVAILAKLSALLKMSFVVGSYTAFFSLSNCLVPLVGAYTNLPAVVSFGLLGMIIRYAIGSLAFFKIAAFHIPGIFAGLAWITAYRPVQLFVPALCMILFIAHPVGGAAWLYTLYWLIPMAIYVSNRQSIFAQALASTLVAHAVGATIWLYADPLHPAVWLGLIPVVAYERLLFALGMTVAHTVLSRLSPRGAYVVNQMCSIVSMNMRTPDRHCEARSNVAIQWISKKSYIRYVLTNYCNYWIATSQAPRDDDRETCL